MDDRIRKLQEATNTDFPYYEYERDLFIDEATIPFCKTDIKPYCDYPKSLKAMGMGIGRLAHKDNRKAGESKDHLSYKMDLLGWIGIVSYNKGRRNHWEVLGKMFMPALIDICTLSNRKHSPKKGTIYVCTQSSMYVEMTLENRKDRIKLKEINGQNSGTYEYLLKEEVGIEVKKRLWIELDEGTIKYIIRERELYDIKEKDFLKNSSEEHPSELYSQKPRLI